MAGGVAKGRRLDSPDVFLRPMMGKVGARAFTVGLRFGLGLGIGFGFSLVCVEATVISKYVVEEEKAVQHCCSVKKRLIFARGSSPRYTSIPLPWHIFSINN